jgi:predicted homoserine dehydrogenase-like protein
MRPDAFRRTLLAARKGPNMADAGSSPLRVGVIGAGWVSQHHLAAWRRLDGRARVVAIADPAEARARERASAFGIERIHRDAGQRPIIDKLSAETRAIMKDPAVVEQLTKVDVIPVGNTPAQCSALVAEETDRWASVLRSYSEPLQKCA